jgi:hypothetical protein
MNNGDMNPAAPAIVTTDSPPLDKFIDRYEKALRELESAKSNPSFEQIIEVLVARDMVEKKWGKDENPSGRSIARLIKLDNQLKEQRQAIGNAKCNSSESLSQCKESLNIPQANWWWDLAKQEQEPILNQAIKEYEQAIDKLETTSKPNSELREVLLARDKVEQIRKEEKNPPPEKIDEIMKLDDRLWKQEEKIAQHEEQVNRWKVHFNPPLSHWWWQIATEAPYFIECVKRYEDALKEMEEISKQGEKKLTKRQYQEYKDRLDSSILKLLRTRDALEKAIKNQSYLPESISKIIVESDNKLKGNRLTIANQNKLLEWKKSLNPSSSNWWWNFKPTLFGNDEEPLPLRDRMWIVGATLCIALATACVINTTQTFQSNPAKNKEKEVRTDTAQNSIVILQGLGLLAAGGTAMTKKGQKMLENLIASIPGLPPNWQAPTTFILSFSALGVTFGINYSLPTFGNWYFAQGKELEYQKQLYEAEQKYLQAKKFFASKKDKVKISLALGGVYEEQGNLKEAVNEYKSALATDNLQIINALSRAMILEASQKVGWTGKITDTELIRQAEAYLHLGENKSQSPHSKGEQHLLNNSTSSDNKCRELEKKDIYKLKLDKNTYINRGLFNWSKIDFNTEVESPDDRLLNKAKYFFDCAEKNDNELNRKIQEIVPDENKNSEEEPEYKALLSVLAKPGKYEELNKQQDKELINKVYQAFKPDPNRFMGAKVGCYRALANELKSVAQKSKSKKGGKADPVDLSPCETYLNMNQGEDDNNINVNEGNMMQSIFNLLQSNKAFTLKPKNKNSDENLNQESKK